MILYKQTIIVTIISIALLSVCGHVATNMVSIYDDRDVVFVGVTAPWFAIIMMSLYFVLAFGTTTWWTHTIWRAMHDKSSLGECVVRKVENAILNVNHGK